MTDHQKSRLMDAHKVASEAVRKARNLAEDLDHPSAQDYQTLAGGLADVGRGHGSGAYDAGSPILNGSIDDDQENDDAMESDTTGAYAQNGLDDRDDDLDEAMELSAGHKYTNHGPMDGDEKAVGVMEALRTPGMRKKLAEAVASGRVKGERDARNFVLREARRAAPDVALRESRRAVHRENYPLPARSRRRTMQLDCGLRESAGGGSLGNVEIDGGKVRRKTGRGNLTLDCFTGGGL